MKQSKTNFVSIEDIFPEEKAPKEDIDEIKIELKEEHKPNFQDLQTGCHFEYSDLLERMENMKDLRK